MTRNYRVHTKATAASPWKDTGIIESNKPVAQEVWTDIVKKLRYHSFKLEPVTYGIAIER